MKRRVLFIVFGLLLILLTGVMGCASSAKKVESTSKIEFPAGPPEPYTKAIAKLAEGDNQTSLKYLDLTIEDFANQEEYCYRARLIESLYFSAQSYTVSIAANLFLKGVQHQSSLIVNDAEMAKITEAQKIFTEKLDTYGPLLKQNTAFVLDNYEKYKDVTIKITLPKSTESNTNALNWFADVGYPVPEASEINQYLKANGEELFSSGVPDVIKNGKIDYPTYFAIMGNNNWEVGPNLSARCYSMVMHLTQNDKYNENRLNAEESLHELKAEGISIENL
ncbi:MAG: hypothetical protein U9N81_00095 [Bacillota bacterium]|nr:hypothetical protein [Bacillota bacterium]